MRKVTWFQYQAACLVFILLVMSVTIPLFIWIGLNDNYYIVFGGLLGWNVKNIMHLIGIYTGGER
jgi:hypothetical protein